MNKMFGDSARGLRLTRRVLIFMCCHFVGSGTILLLSGCRRGDLHGSLWMIEEFLLVNNSAYNSIFILIYPYCMSCFIQSILCFYDFIHCFNDIDCTFIYVLVRNDEIKMFNQSKSIKIRKYAGLDYLSYCWKWGPFSFTFKVIFPFTLKKRHSTSLLYTDIVWPRGGKRAKRAVVVINERKKTFWKKYNPS